MLHELHISRGGEIRVLKGFEQVLILVGLLEEGQGQTISLMILIPSLGTTCCLQ